MSMNVPHVVARIKEILEQVEYSGTSKFERVYVALPRSLPIQSPLGSIATFWYVGEAEKEQTLGNVMRTDRWRVRLFWRVPITEPTAEALEIAVAEANANVQAAFRADSKLTYNGTDKVTDLDIELSESDEFELSVRGPDGQFAQTPYRYLEFDLLIKDLEGEAISA